MSQASPFTFHIYHISIDVGCCASRTFTSGKLCAHKQMLIDAFVQTNIHTVSFGADLWQFASFVLFLSLSLLTFKRW